MAENENGNIAITKSALSSSAEDLSEYTDADESISSAPTEFLAEFLSAVMLKDYKTALKYCHLILQYEPNNSTAKEFYPLIVTKLRLETANNASSGSNNETDDFLKDDNCSDSNDSDVNSASASSSDDEDDDDDDDEKNHGSSSSVSADRHSDGTTASYSSLEDDEAVENNSNTKYAQIDNADFGNGNAKIGTVSPTITTKKAWELTEQNLSKKLDHVTLNIHTSSDSESPTEPVSQQLIAQLRSRVINCKND